MNEREQAWGKVHASPPAGWWVGQPSYHPERQEWLLYAYDPAERPVVGIRRREWQAVAPSELQVVAEVARCLGDFATRECRSRRSFLQRCRTGRLRR